MEETVTERDYINSEAFVLQSRLISNSFEKLLGRPLLNGSVVPHAMYEADLVILSHDGGEDPRFTYANRAAQKLWELSLEEFIGMPSRLSAEPDEREARHRMLTQAADKGYFDSYCGIRISKSGRRFHIENAIIWNLLDAEGTKVGQAAAFEECRFLPIDPS